MIPDFMSNAHLLLIPPGKPTSI